MHKSISHGLKAGHKYVIGIDLSVQEFLNEGKGIFDDEGAHRDRSEERDEESGYLIRVVINTG